MIGKLVRTRNWPIKQGSQGLLFRPNVILRKSRFTRISFSRYRTLNQNISDICCSISTNSIDLESRVIHQHHIKFSDSYLVPFLRYESKREPHFFYFGDSRTLACRTCFFFAFGRSEFPFQSPFSPLCRKCLQFWPNSVLLRRMASLSGRYLTNSLAIQEMIDQFGMNGKEAQQDPCSVPEL